MVSKCASPSCPARFRYLSEGKLFRLEVEYGRCEYFWLCPGCATKVIPKTETGKVVLVPLKRGAR